MTATAAAQACPDDHRMRERAREVVAELADRLADPAGRHRRT
ncbi:hypothetical protein [Streptomyces chattanoogensis]